MTNRIHDRNTSRTNRRSAVRRAALRAAQSLEQLENRRMLSYSPVPGMDEPLQEHDHALHAANKDDGPTTFDPEGMAAGNQFVLQGNEWTQAANGSPATVTYGYSNALNGAFTGVTNAEIRNSIEEGLQLWAAVAPLHFEFSSAGNGTVLGINDIDYNVAPNAAQILIGHEFFDGVGSVLAHGFFPPPNGQEIAGDIHFDNGDTWDTIDGVNIFDLVEVATHEIGHTLGLNHQANPPTDAIMNPFYGARYNGPGTGFLLADDIAGIQTRYGAGFGYVVDEDGNMHLSGTEANNTFTLTVAGGVITGTSTGFGSFTRTTAGVNAIIINGRGGSDTFNIDSTTIPVSAGGDAGNDTFNLGNGDIDNNLNSNVSVFGEAGTDTVFFDDAIDDNSVDDTYTLTTNTLTKSSEPSTFTFSTMENVTLTAGLADNAITIDGFLPTVNATVNGNDGNDTITNGPNDLNTNWNGSLVLTGGAGIDAINLDDSGDATADEYTINSNSFGVTAGITTELFPYSTFESFTWLTSDQPTRILVNSTNSAVDYTVNAAAGNDTVHIAGTSASDDAHLELVGGSVALNGGIGVDTVTLHDEEHIFDETYTITSTTASRTNGFGGLTYAAMEGLTLNVANASPQLINVNSTLAATPVTVHGNAGNDAMVVAALTADWDASILGHLDFNGAGGTDSLRILDTGDVGADNYNVLSFQTTKSSVGSSIGYATIEDYTLQANNDVNTIQVNSSFGEPFRIFANGGADTIDVEGNFIFLSVLVDGGTGLDNVRVNDDAAGIAEVHFNTTQDLASLNIFQGGTVVMEQNGSRVIDTDALSIVGTGKLDLTDNDLIVDYAGASQLAAVTALINQGRNGGLWDGNGITSSTAGANPLHNTTLGRMEGSEFDSIYGAAALFSGRTVDATSVLVKYTYYGDADFSGVVTFDDYSRTDAGFNFGRTGWVNGDYDGNSIVNFDDYSLIDLAFNTQGAAL